LITVGKITSIFLSDPPAAEKAPPAAAATAGADEEIEETVPVPATAASAVARVTLAAISALEWLAESGQRARPADALSRLDDLANQAAQLRLPRLAALLQHTVYPGDLLRTRWILSVMESGETA
jgi:multidrug efflux pump subunit AcrA (membrane-fusion protein)